MLSHGLGLRDQPLQPSPQKLSVDPNEPNAALFFVCCCCATSIHGALGIVFASSFFNHI